MTTFITIHHNKSDGTARVPEETLRIWEKRGWKQVKDPAGVTGPADPSLPGDPTAPSPNT